MLLYVNQLACAWCQVAHKHWGISLSQLCFISNTWYVYNNFQLWASDISNKGQIKNMWSFARNKEVQIYSVILIRTLCFIIARHCVYCQNYDVWLPVSVIKCLCLSVLLSASVSVSLSCLAGILSLCMSAPICLLFLFRKCLIYDWISWYFLCD